jgi:hypothetical protein
VFGVWSLDVANLWKSSFRFDNCCKDFGPVTFVYNFALFEFVNENNLIFQLHHGWLAYLGIELTQLTFVQTKKVFNVPWPFYELSEFEVCFRFSDSLNLWGWIVLVFGIFTCWFLFGLFFCLHLVELSSSLLAHHLWWLH